MNSTGNLLQILRKEDVSLNELKVRDISQIILFIPAVPLGVNIDSQKYLFFIQYLCGRNTANAAWSKKSQFDKSDSNVHAFGYIIWTLVN